MSAQPEALRLADALTHPTYPDWVVHMPAPWHPPAQEVREAAAELRRLHAENEMLTVQRDEARRTVREAHEAGTRLTAQRDALLEEISALREVLLYSLDNQGRYRKKHRKIVDAAIKAVEGE